MSQIARTGYVAIAKQTAKGTPNTTLTTGLSTTDVSMSGQADRLDDVEEIGGGRDYLASSSVMAGFTVSGDVSGLMRPNTFGLLLLAAGFTSAAPTQDGTTGAWTHVFTPALTGSYLTIETRWGSTDAIRRFSDCLVDSLSVSLDANGRATYSASLIGTTESWQGTPAVPVYETDAVADYKGSAVTFDALGTYKFESVEVSIANNLSSDEFVIGSRMLDDVTFGAREVSMTGTIKAGANTPSVTDLYRAAVYGAKAATAPGGADPYHSAASVTFGSDKFAGTSVTKRFASIFAIPDLVMNGFPLEASGSDRLSLDLDCRAYKGAGNIVDVTLQNTRGTAY